MARPSPGTWHAISHLLDQVLDLSTDERPAWLEALRARDAHAADALAGWTKRNASGEEIGTGLGMWIVKSVVEEYGGAVKLIYPNQGFGVRFRFPSREKTSR